MVCGRKELEKSALAILNCNVLCAIIPYHSISDFRKQNPSGLKTCSNSLFLSLKMLTWLAVNHRYWRHKSRAHNSKKANFNQKKIERHLVYIEERTQEYLAELAKMIYRITLQSLRLQKNRALKRITLRTSRRKTKRSGQPQISTTDQDARALLVQG
jgi:hypothetical protein